LTIALRLIYLRFKIVHRDGAGMTINTDLAELAATAAAPTRAGQPARETPSVAGYLA
jgi:hypothetical protein